MKNKSKTIVLLVSIIVAVCLAFVFLFKAVSKKISGTEPHQQTSVVEKTEDPVSTPEGTVSTENPDESDKSEQTAEPLDLYAKEQEVNERREKTSKYARYSSKMNTRVTEHTGAESLEEKTFWFTDYEEDSDKNAVIDAFEYGLSGKDDFYITYVSENGTQGVKYQIATDELDQTYSGNIMTGE